MPIDDENDTDRKKKSPMIKGKIRIKQFLLAALTAYLDTELLLAIDSPAFTQHFQQVQDSYFQQSLQAEPEGGCIAGTIPPRPVSGLKWGMIYALYLPVKLFKYLA